MAHSAKPRTLSWAARARAVQIVSASASSMSSRGLEPARPKMKCTWLASHHP